MTRDELIRELQAIPFPEKQVRIVMSRVEIHDELGDSTIYVGDAQAVEIDEVRNLGPFVIVRGL